MLVGMEEREGGGACGRGLGLRLGGEGGEERSGIVDLLAGHEARELVAAAGARGVTCGERARIPGVGSDVIERQASSLLVEGCQGGLRPGQALLRGEAQPAGSFRVIEWDAQTFVVGNAQTGLSLGGACIGGGAKTAGRFCLIAGGP